MVKVKKVYVKKADLPKTIENLLETHERLRVEYPCDVENFFLVKAWSKRK